MENIHAAIIQTALQRLQVVAKETTAESYGEFWKLVNFLEEKADPKRQLGNRQEFNGEEFVIRTMLEAAARNGCSRL